MDAGGRLSMDDAMEGPALVSCAVREERRDSCVPVLGAGVPAVGRVLGSRGEVAVTEDAGA
jgi:hypothetical protein